MSTDEILFELEGELNVKAIKDTPAVQIYSRTAQTTVPGFAFMYVKAAEGERVLVEYNNGQTNKWVTLESLQRDNGNRIRILFGADPS